MAASVTLAAARLAIAVIGVGTFALGCGGSASGRVVNAATERSEGPPTPPRGAAPAPAPEKPADRAPWTCKLTDHGDGILVRDDGAAFLVALRASPNEPFDEGNEEIQAMSFRKVMPIAELEDPSYDAVFSAAGVDRHDVATVTVYGIAGAHAFSAGITVLSDASGRPIGHAGWLQRIGLATPCT